MSSHPNNRRLYLLRNMNLRRFERQDAAVPGSDSDPTNFFDDSDGSYLFVTVRSPIARPSNPGSPPMYVDEQDFSIVVYDRALLDEEADANIPAPETEVTPTEPQVENQSVSGSVDNQQDSPVSPLISSSPLVHSPSPTIGSKRSSSDNGDETDDERYSTIALRVKRRRNRLQNIIGNVNRSIVSSEAAGSDNTTSNLTNSPENVDDGTPPTTSVAPAIADDNFSSNNSYDSTNFVTANTSFDGADINLDDNSGSSNNNSSSSLTHVLVATSAITVTFSDYSGPNSSLNSDSPTPVSATNVLVTVAVTEEGSNLVSTESSNLASDEASNSSGESSQTNESVLGPFAAVIQDTELNSEVLADDANSAHSPANTGSATDDDDSLLAAHVSFANDTE